MTQRSNKRNEQANKQRDRRTDIHTHRIHTHTSRWNGKLTLCLSANWIGVSHSNRHSCIRTMSKMNFGLPTNQLYDNIDSDDDDSHNHYWSLHHYSLHDNFLVNHYHAKFRPPFATQMTFLLR